VECHIEVDTGSGFRAILPYSNLIDLFDYKTIQEELIPTPGTRINAIVKNFVDDILYLSTKSQDLAEESIASFMDFYQLVDKFKIGSILEGTVEKVMNFGIFVNLATPFPGLIDIGHTPFNGGSKLPRDTTKWPKEGEPIKCLLSYFRFHDKQMGLGWFPDINQ
jgi:hypothetical protein